MENYGMDAKIVMRDGHKFTLQNCTEIHFGYLDAYKDRANVAFESDIHGTGASYDRANIIECEITPATFKRKEFYSEDK